MKNSGDRTHPCRSPVATVNGRDLTLLTWKQSAGQVYSDLSAGNRRPSTSYSATLHKPVHEEPGRMLSRVRQSMSRRVWHTPKISQKFAGGWNFVCSATAGTKTALGIIQVWFNYSLASFFKALGNVNVHYFKIPKKQRRPHKRPSRATCGPRVACLRPQSYGMRGRWKYILPGGLE